MYFSKRSFSPISSKSNLFPFRRFPIGDFSTCISSVLIQYRSSKSFLIRSIVLYRILFIKWAILQSQCHIKVLRTWRWMIVNVLSNRWLQVSDCVVRLFSNRSLCHSSPDNHLSLWYCRWYDRFDHVCDVDTRGAFGVDVEIAWLWAGFLKYHCWDWISSRKDTEQLTDLGCGKIKWWLWLWSLSSCSLNSLADPAFCFKVQTNICRQSPDFIFRTRHLSCQISA